MLASRRPAVAAAAAAASSPDVGPYFLSKTVCRAPRMAVRVCHPSERCRPVNFVATRPPCACFASCGRTVVSRSPSSQGYAECAPTCGAWWVRAITQGYKHVTHRLPFFVGRAVVSRITLFPDDGLRTGRRRTSPREHHTHGNRDTLTRLSTSARPSFSACSFLHLLPPSQQPVECTDLAGATIDDYCERASGEK